MSDKKRSETVDAIITGLKIGSILLVLLLWAIGYIMEGYAPPIINEQGLTPEQFAAQKYAEDEKAKEPERLLQKEYQARGIAGLKASELLLDGAEKDMKEGNIGSDMNMQFIGAVLEVIYGSARSIQEAWDNSKSLLPADVKYLKSMESKLSSFQQRALPKMRLAFKNRAKETLWINDVTARTSGSGNTILTLYGYHFTANANIKLVQEQLYDLMTKLRFKKIQYAYSDYDDDIKYYYKLDTPSDSTIAAYNNEFQKLSKKPE